MHDSGSVPCDGWWAQEMAAGRAERHEMDGLRLTISAARIVGSGVDVVGAFTLDGSRAPDGRVRLVKQYIGQHAVGYGGHFDGRARLAGTWRLDGMAGPWEIVLRRPLEARETERVEARVETGGAMRRSPAGHRCGRVA